MSRQSRYIAGYLERRFLRFLVSKPLAWILKQKGFIKYVCFGIIILYIINQIGLGF